MKKNDFMKTIYLLTVSFFLLTASCSKKQEQKNNQTKTPPTQWKSFKDTTYPIALEYPVIPTKEDNYESGKASTHTYFSNEKYEIYAGVNLSEEFPDYPGADEPFSAHPLIDKPLLIITFFNDVNESLLWRFSYPKNTKIEEVVLNSIPMLRLVDPKTKYVKLHIPLIPGYYIIMDDGFDTAEEEHIASYGRIKELIEKILKSIRWERPIDTSTQEFKEWKARILWLIEKASGMPDMPDSVHELYSSGLSDEEIENNPEHRQYVQKEQVYVSSVLEVFRKRWPTPVQPAGYQPTGGPKGNP